MWMIREIDEKRIDGVGVRKGRVKERGENGERWIRVDEKGSIG